MQFIRSRQTVSRVEREAIFSIFEFIVNRRHGSETLNGRLWVVCLQIDPLMTLSSRIMFCRVSSFQFSTAAAALPYDILNEGHTAPKNGTRRVNSTLMIIN